MIEAAEEGSEQAKEEAAAKAVNAAGGAADALGQEDNYRVELEKELHEAKESTIKLNIILTYTVRGIAMWRQMRRLRRASPI